MQLTAEIAQSNASEKALARRERAGHWRILRNTASILVSDAMGEALTGYAIALSAYYLGPRAFGELAEAQAFLDPFEAVATFGLTPVTIMLAAQRGGCDGELRGTVSGLRVAFAVVSGLLTLVMAMATGRAELIPVLGVLAFGLVVTAYWNVQMLPFQYDQSMHRLLALPFVAAIVRVGTAWLAVLYLRDPVGFQLSGLAAGIATAVLFGWAGRRWYPAKLRFDRKLALRVLRISWPAAVEAVLMMAYLRGNYLFLHHADPLIKGEYAAADRLLRPLLGVAAALFVSSLPTVAILAEERDFKVLRRMFGKAVLRIAQVLTVLVAVAVPLSSLVLAKWAPAYAGAVGPFRILLVGSLFMFLNQLARTYIAGLGRYRTMMGLAFATLALYLVLAFVLIPRLGGVGAAWAVTLTEAASAGVLIALVFRILGEASAKKAKDDEATAAAVTPNELASPAAE